MPTEKIPNRYNYNFYPDISSHFNKKHITDTYIKRFLRITQSMFKYNNLPNTIPERDLKLILQTQKCATIANVPDKGIYAFQASLGDKPNPYFMPTKSIIANPALKYNANLTIDYGFKWNDNSPECVVVPNDSMYQGLIPIISHTAYLLAECDISFKLASINCRYTSLIAAPNDSIREDAIEFLKQIEDGELGVILDEGFEDRLSVHNKADTANNIKALIELRQYIIGTFYQDIGINSTFNMKREAINEAEATMNDDILYPSIDDMLNTQNEHFEMCNKMFGTNINVEISSVWQKLRKQDTLSLKQIEAEIQNDNTEYTKDEESENTDG